MEFLIISGLSGGGKSSAVNALEDLSFYCVDNMPVALIPKFAELCLATRGRYDRVALVTDIRGGHNFDELAGALDEMKKMGCDHRILFVEASPQTIINRYKETRRKHPLGTDAVSIEDAVNREMELLRPVREKADYILDTTGLTLAQLRREIMRIFTDTSEEKSFEVIVMSFGFKFGIPSEADLVFDVRFLPNPYYENKLRHLCGLDGEVEDYIFSFPQSSEFLDKAEDMLGFLMPYYIKEGKQSLTVAFGCTGGRHRSVAIANRIAAFIENRGYRTETSHRDITRS